MKATAYRIINERTNEVELEGIVRHTADNIYPAQDRPDLVEEFPNLPYEVELHHFQVEGLRVETYNFSLTWEEATRLKQAKYWYD